MKKIFLFGLMTFTAVSLMAQVNVATFENEAGGINLTTPESNWFGADEPAENDFSDWTSGDFSFQTYNSGTYHAGVIVTNETSTEFVDWNDAWRSISGGAYEGNNYAVWNMCYYGSDIVSFAAQSVNGVFVNNNTYAANSMCNGDGSAKKFGATDWFKLTFTGYKEDVELGAVDFYLAKDGKYVNDWTFVDLSSLGEIDAIEFSMSSTDNGDWGMNTPAYFCMDNFGAVKPDGYVAPEMVEFPEATAINNVEKAASAQKVMRDGQMYILRNGVMYNVNGAAVK